MLVSESSQLQCKAAVSTKTEAKMDATETRTNGGWIGLITVFGYAVLCGMLYAGHG